MAVRRVEVIGHSAVDPATLWQVAGDFAGRWHPLIETMAAQRDARGALIRAFTVKGETTLYREQLLYRSDSDRTLAYCHLEGIAGARSYCAELQIDAVEGGGSTITWSAEIEAEDGRAEAIAEGTEAIFRLGIEALSNLATDARFSSPAAEMACRPGARPAADRDSCTQFIDGEPRLALTVAGSAAGSLFSPAGRSAERMRGDEGDDPRGNTPSSGPSDHLLPEGEKRERTLILFLHGIGGGRSNWQRQIEALGSGFRAAALDLRGYGDSRLGSEPSTIDAYCADILRVAGHFGAERFVLVGLSYGAWIATSFAMRHPDRLMALVLSGGCTGMSEASVGERENFLKSRQAPLDAGLSPADFAANVVEVLASPGASEEIRASLHASMAAIPAATYRDAVYCFTHPPERFDFARLTMPVLMITGEFDRLAPPDEIRGVARRIAGEAPLASVRFETIEGAGHVCNLEQPEAYNRILSRFLAEVCR